VTRRCSQIDQNDAPEDARGRDDDCHDGDNQGRERHTPIVAVREAGVKPLIFLRSESRTQDRAGHRPNGDGSDVVTGRGCRDWGPRSSPGSGEGRDASFPPESSRDPGPL
jgi:hypothetical protein